MMCWAAVSNSPTSSARTECAAGHTGANEAPQPKFSNGAHQHQPAAWEYPVCFDDDLEREIARLCVPLKFAAPLMRVTC